MEGDVELDEKDLHAKASNAVRSVLKKYDLSAIDGILACCASAEYFLENIDNEKIYISKVPTEFSGIIFLYEVLAELQKIE